MRRTPPSSSTAKHFNSKEKDFLDLLFRRAESELRQLVSLSGLDQRMPAMEVDLSEEQGFTRAQAKYESKNEKFQLKFERYQGQQYTQVYVFRLQHARNFLKPLVRKRWPQFRVTNILGLEERERCVVIGTLYKQMKLKPTVLDEYSKERSVVRLVTPRSFTDPSDVLILEDEGGRTMLVGDGVSSANYVTGVVVAVLGEAGSDGEFHMMELLEPGLGPQPPLPRADDRCAKYVALVSGLRVGANDTNPLQAQILVDQLTGNFGFRGDQDLSSQIVRTIIAGDSTQLQTKALGGQPLSAEEQRKLGQPMRVLDMLLTQLAAAMPVDIMPGAIDPANFSLPQQPLHKCLFPGATEYSTFATVTNPHQFDIDDVMFLGTSGQNIVDLDKYSEANDRLDYLERTLKWQHIAPTAPDTLGCYPFPDKDPFVIEPSCPHVYFCGNQEMFGTRLLKGPEGQHVRLICVPKFSLTGVAVLVNLKNLECRCLNISTSYLEQ